MDNEYVDTHCRPLCIFIIPTAHFFQLYATSKMAHLVLPDTRLVPTIQETTFTKPKEPFFAIT